MVRTAVQYTNRLADVLAVRQPRVAPKGACDLCTRSASVLLQVVKVDLGSLGSSLHLKALCYSSAFFT